MAKTNIEKAAEQIQKLKDDINAKKNIIRKDAEKLQQMREALAEIKKKQDG